MAPTMSPKPQLIQHAIEDMRVTVVIAAAGVFGNAASLRNPFFTSGASARAEPQTSTRAICMENARRLHTPPPQFSTTSTGDCPVKAMAAIPASTVSIIANTNGSGRYFLINFTDKSISFPSMVILNSYPTKKRGSFTSLLHISEQIISAQQLF